MRINHNIPALNSYRNLGTANSSNAKSMEKLSSGLRINRAADDAAGLAISETMRGQIKGLNQASRNSQDAISLLQTAEGGLTETNSILTRMRELSVQASNDTYTSNDRQEMQKEIDQLKDEIDRIANTTSFNNKNLLDGSASAITSSDKVTTKVMMRGGLRTVDSFGQKSSGGGSYKLDVSATAGNAQIQKSNIFKAITGNVNSLSESHVGKSQFAGTVGAAGNSDVVTMDFQVNGQNYSFNFTNDASATTTEVATAIANGITNTAGLKDLVDVTSGVGVFTITSKNADVDFNVKWSNAGTTTIGGTTGSTTIANAATQATYVAVKAADRNIGQISLDATNFVNAGNYSIDTKNLVAGDVNTNGTIQGPSNLPTEYRQNGTGRLATTVTAGVATANQSLLLEVTGINETTGKVTFSYSTAEMSKTAATTHSTGSITLNDSRGTNNNTVIGGVTFSAFTLTAASNFTLGDKILVNTSAAQVATDERVLVNRDSSTDMAFTVTSGANDFDNATTNFNYYQLDSTTGKSKEASFSLKFNTNLADETGASSFKITSTVGTSGELASLDTKLSDIDKFWDASGKFLLNDPQTITLVQGNGNKASVTLFNTDTIKDVRDKLNTAIATGLKQGDLVSSSDSRNFVSYVTSATSGTSEAEAGTFVLRSAQAGQDGVINVIGSESLVNALGMSTIQKATESKFSINVTDATNGTSIASGVQISGNTLIGVVHQNVDVKFDSNADINVAYNSSTKKYDLTGDTTNSYSTFIHLVDNSQVFQIGANEMQDMGAAIGSMGSEALGVNNILVTDRESAGRATTTIDSAISRVSAQRSSIGAVQNRLEHTINNLGVASENLTSAESRIRDVDMAAEMMEYSKTNILSQAATAMLAQANKQPQNVLQLLQG